MRNVSIETARNLDLLAPSETLVWLVEVHNSLLAVPMQFVVVNVTVTSNGKEYVPLGCSFQLPQDKEAEIPASTLTLSNIGNEFAEAAEITRGFNNSQVRLLAISRKRPDHVEWDIDFDIKSVTLTEDNLVLQLVFSTIIDRVSTPISYRLATAPGLF